MKFPEGIVAIALGNWNDIIDKLAKDLHNGKLDPRQLNRDVLLKNYEQMNKGVTETFDVVKNPETRRSAQQLSKNLYIFSGAKSYQQLQVMNSELLDDEGKIRSFSAFKKEILQIHEKYNVNYLQAEYQTAKASAQTARDWQRFQANKERYPHLKYNTQRDDAVSDEHAPLDGIVMHIDDPRWNALIPPLRFRCRCYLTQTGLPLTQDKLPDVPIDPRFQHNPGKTGEVFDAAHPYFQIPSNVKEEIRRSFEFNKLIYPRYQKAENAKGVQISHYAHLDDLPNNLKFAKLIANQLKTTVKIREHIESTNSIKKWKNPEYLIGNKKGDLKKCSSKGTFKTRLEEANKQGSRFMAIELDGDWPSYQTKVQRYLHGGLTAEYFSSIDYIIFIRNEKVVKLTRKEMKSNDFAKLENLQKQKAK